MNRYYVKKITSREVEKRVSKSNTYEKPKEEVNTSSEEAELKEENEETTSNDEFDAKKKDKSFKKQKALNTKYKGE